uniref:Xylanolytic transcriptional activator regulatory domain-containing protein n=1 Tax=Gibberella zeae (strain ATCC MYA-4620 / CBS 123657 / FGSC 9075 / NRRL 31084 / PH-1) TaxID=229533 RepID=A0A098D6I6_GIBZE
MEKRSTAESSPSSNRRTKRAKYAPIACASTDTDSDTCKKRKLKCVREEGEHICRRCAANHGESDIASLNQQVAALQNQVSALTTALQDVSQRLPQLTDPSTTTSVSHGNGSTYRQELRNVRNEPREPQFVGPMRSAYSFQIAENSLSGMGIERRPGTAASLSVSPSESMPDVECERGSLPPRDIDVLPSLGAVEIQRLLELYREEIVTVYPFLEVDDLSRIVTSVLESPEENTLKEIQAIKLVVATALAVEAHGQNNLSKRLIDEVEPVICSVSGEAFIDILELQLMIMLSIYWFYCGEELLAWRAIGIAGRETNEIGLHRRASLMENFKDPQERDLALRCFWCVYILDRRWSYGTSLSFGISDRDIDPQLPEPTHHPYLLCMVSYARLCSKVWEELPLDSSPLSVPKDKVDLFDFLTQKWMHSIPHDLQLVFPRLSQAPQPQPRALQRLRTLLYLRGNHIRSLVLRHHVMSTANLRADIQGAQLVVSLAQDTIQVLVHLNETSDIYARQKPTFNYFLTTALASILLAVCNAPDLFANRCRQDFRDAVKLLENISQQGHVSRRLWRSIRGTINRALSLETSVTSSGNAVVARSLDNEANAGVQRDAGHRLREVSAGSLDLGDLTSDGFGLETDLLNLFSAFEEENILKSSLAHGSLDGQAGIGMDGDLARFNSMM